MTSTSLPHRRVSFVSGVARYDLTDHNSLNLYSLALFHLITAAAVLYMRTKTMLRLVFNIQKSNNSYLNLDTLLLMFFHCLWQLKAAPEKP